jgi:glycosyltransferase involved in cell wall biosynthesis
VTTYRQVLIGASQEDAITGMAQRLGAALTDLGPSELYARHVAPALADRVRQLEQLPPPAPGDVLIYHASYGDPEVTKVLLERREALVLVYHNLSPSAYFLPYDPAVAAALEWGRHELDLLRDRVVATVADSPYNAADLARRGYDSVEVMPVGIEPHRLRGIAPDEDYARELAERFPDGYDLAVSQVLPHKRHEVLVAATHLVNWVHHNRRGLVIVGAKRLALYWDALHRYARRLNVARILFAGMASDRQLATLFASAGTFVTASAHEGLALPPLEAMSLGVPVIATDVGALGHTIGGAGVVLPAGAGPVLFAEAIVEVVGNTAVRDDLVEQGFQRVEAVRASGATGRFLSLLEGVV